MKRPSCLLLGVLLACMLALGPAGCLKGPRGSDFVYAPWRSMGKPRPDKALVYFFRENSLLCGVNYYVYAGFERMGGLPCKAYFYDYFEPGYHLFWAEAYMRGEQSLRVEPGKTYYIRIDTKYNDFGLAIKPVFTVVSESVGRDAVFSSREVSLR